MTFEMHQRLKETRFRRDCTRHEYRSNGVSSAFEGAGRTLALLINASLLQNV
jgi:hypothetical protein